MVKIEEKMFRAGKYEEQSTYGASGYSRKKGKSVKTTAWRSILAAKMQSKRNRNVGKSYGTASGKDIDGKSVKLTCNNLRQKIRKSYWSTGGDVDRQTQVTGAQVVMLTGRRKFYHSMWCQLHRSKGKGKAIPVQAWTGPEGSRRLRLPDFKTIGT
jgi:hypothetical protein